MVISIFVDESGDLGWKFTAPYRYGGSSRHITIAAIVIEHEKRHLLKRLMKDLYKKTKTPKKEEVKWGKLNAEHRVWIAEKLAKLKTKLGDDIAYHSITVAKENVQEHIRQDANKLYNYMTKRLLINVMADCKEVHLNIDQRSIKVQSGNSLHDYLQTELWFTHEKSTNLFTTQCDSKYDYCVQLSDIVSGIVQSHFEDGRSKPFLVLEDDIHCQTLFFH